MLKKTLLNNFSSSVKAIFLASIILKPVSTQDENSAYKVQAEFVKLVSQSDPIAGYKAGLTSTAGQKKFSVSQALSGVLFSSGNIENPMEIRMRDAGKLMIETEIGFILAAPISKPLESIEALQAKVESVVGVIEFPDIGFAEPAKISGLDLISANVASHQYLIGEPIALSQIKALDSIKAQLLFQNEVAINGQASDALGSQWQALLWLVNQIVNQGYQLSSGELLITGALGKMIPAKPGDYQANFEPIGQNKL